MLKRTSLIFLLALLCTNVFSKKNFDFGFRAGFGSSDLKSGINTIEGSEFDDVSLLSIQYGTFSRIHMKRFYLQTEIYWNPEKGEMSNTNGTSFLNFKKLEVPMLLGFKLLEHKKSNLRIYGGGVLSVVRLAKVTNPDLYKLNSSDFKSRVFGWELGIGTDISFLCFDARLKRNSNLLVSSASRVLQSQVFMLSVGIKVY